MIVLSTVTARARQLSCADPNYDAKLARQLGMSVTTPSRVHSKPKPEKGFRVERKSANVTINGVKKKVSYNLYHAAKKPAHGTVVVLGGGPGFVNTDGGRPKDLPKDVDVVVFDYNGVGDNGGKSLPPDQLSIEAEAEMTKGIIKSAKLENYAIYGISFGTTVGTVATSMIEHDPDMTGPKSLVLSGVVSNEPVIDHAAGRAAVANAAWNMLTPKQQTDFKRAYKKITRGMSKKNIELMDQTWVGNLTFSPKRVAKMLNNFSAVVNGKRKPSPPEPMDNAASSDDSLLVSSPQAIRQFRAAGCEMLGNSHEPPSAEKLFGGLIPNRDEQQLGTMCGCPLLSDKAYDSKNYPIEDTPIVYVNSDTDVSTPLQSAKYHFDNQPTDTKFMFVTKNGVHDDLAWRYADCAAPFWHASLVGDLDAVKNAAAGMGTDGCEKAAPVQMASGPGVSR